MSKCLVVPIVLLFLCACGSGSKKSKSDEEVNLDAYTETDRSFIVKGGSNGENHILMTIVRRDYVNRNYQNSDIQHEVYLTLESNFDAYGAVEYTITNYSTSGNHMYTIKNAVNNLAKNIAHSEGVISTSAVSLSYSTFSIKVTVQGVEYVFTDENYKGVLADSDGGTSGSLDGGGIVNPDQNICPKFQNPGIRPVTNSPYFCGQTDAWVSAILNDVNSFWGSNMQLCSCGPDIPYPFGPYCNGNAVVFSPVIGGGGYVYYNSTFLYDKSIAYGTELMAGYIMGHEAGHNIQNYFRQQSYYPNNVTKELGADCFAGYYLGWMACNSRTTGQDMEATLRGACEGGGSSSFFDPSGHGSCQERSISVLRGFNAYFNNYPPLLICN